MNLVKKSLYTCIGVLMALLVLQGAQSLFQLSRLSTATDDVVASGRLSNDARQLWLRFLAAEDAYRRATAFVDAASADVQRKAFADAAAALHGNVQSLRRDATPALQPGAAALQSQVDAWLAMARRHVGAEGQTELPSYHLLEAARAELEAAVTTFAVRSADAALATVASAHALARQAAWWTGGEVLLALGLGLVLGWRALKSLHRQLGADASEVARVANTVADGDLTVAIAADGLPDGSVMAAMARMQGALGGTVARVLGVSTHLADGSSAIASSNDTLSRRTEEQAAELQRTAATMSQLDATVRANADSLGAASRLADEASAVASRGGEVVGQVVATMHGINDSSRRIADIIGVIDSIAFQTNILALNAAVEAARAGEQGRGFAVVASEVRSLAQRSAGAAQEIKTLINDSVGRVESGSQLVEDAGRTMTDVAQAIGRVTAVMGEIRSAGERQTGGVDAVARAIGALDAATRQNAALAERSAGAAVSLQAHGRELVDAMAFFRAGAVTAEAAGDGAWTGAERRGPDRARNVVRPAFGAAARDDAAEPPRRSTA